VQPLEQINDDVKIKHWSDLWFRPDKKAGYVSITDLHTQKFYGLNDKNKVPSLTKGKKQQYISLNAFDVDFNTKEFSRKAQDLKQIRLIGIDIDQYKFDLTIPDTLDILFDMVKEGEIPKPNLVITSRGVQIFYDILNGASPKMAWLTGYITEQFIAKLKTVGADGNAKDLSRVMRVPESINQRNGATVTPQIWREDPYTLKELQSYCKPLTKFSNSYKKKSNKVVVIDKALLVFYRVNYARLSDFERLITLRNGEFTHKRNVLLYMYSFHQALVHDSEKDTLDFMNKRFQKVYSRADKELSDNEFERTVKSAYKDSKTFFEHYTGNGFRMSYELADGIIKPYKTSTIIDKLDITEDEQRELKTLVSPLVRAEHDRERKTAENRAKGIKPMNEYNEQRKTAQAEQAERIARLMDENPDMTQKELGNALGVSRMTVSRLKKAYNL